jgi:hypothetical protein
VNSISQRSAQVNPGAEREREFLTRGLNTAIARSRLTVNSLETIAAALRHRQASVTEIREWLKEEGLLELVTRHMRGLTR